jgi:hypothetical protein
MRKYGLRKPYKLLNCKSSRNDNITRNTLNVSIAMMLMVVTVQAQNWPQWRGPNASGIADQGNYPASFSPTNGILWQAELPGKGGSTPIVWDDRIILTSGIGEGAQSLHRSITREL